MNHVLKCLSGLICAFLFSGCIIVDDLNGYWEKAVIDPKLEGTWEVVGGENDSDAPISFIKNGDHYLFKSEDEEAAEEEHIRTLNVGKETFFIFLNEENSGGIMRYKIGDDSLTTYTLKDEILIQAVENKQVAGTVDQDSLLGDVPHLSKLDEATLKFLEKLADSPDNWDLEGVYKRINSLLPNGQEQQNSI